MASLQERYEWIADFDGKSLNLPAPGVSFIGIEEAQVRNGNNLSNRVIGSALIRFFCRSECRRIAEGTLPIRFDDAVRCERMFLGANRRCAAAHQQRRGFGCEISVRIDTGNPGKSWLDHWHQQIQFESFCCCCLFCTRRAVRCATSRATQSEY